MKTKKTSLIKSLVTIVVSVLLVAGIVTGCATTASRSDRVDKQLAISDSTSISLDLTNADVFVGISPDNNVHITYYDTDWHTYEITQSEDKVVIKQIVQMDSSNWKNTDFVVLIPEQFSGSIDINSAFSHIKAEGVSMKGDIFIKATKGGGGINFTSVSANSIVIRANGIKAEGISTTGDILIAANSWSINLKDVKSTDGTLTVDANSMGIKAEEISAKGDILIGANSMGINLNDVTSTDGKLSIYANSGKIKAEEIFTKGDISIEANSRSMTLRDVTSTDGKLTTYANSGGTKAERISTKGDISMFANSLGINLSDATSTNGKITVDGKLIEN